MAKDRNDHETILDRAQLRAALLDLLRLTALWERASARPS
jgi:hypothetical protein